MIEERMRLGSEKEMVDRAIGCWLGGWKTCRTMEALHEEEAPRERKPCGMEDLRTSVACVGELVDM